METHIMKIESISTKALNTTEVIFRTLEPFVFTAGQYVTVTLPTLYHLREQEQYRDFSLISPPEDARRIAIVFRNSDSYFKQEILREWEAGRDITVSIDGPKGIFTLPDDMSIPMVFFAGGVGIAPFLSIIRHVVRTKTPVHITLFYYNRNRESAAYLDELGEYAEFVNFIPVFGDMTPEPIESYAKMHPEQSLWYLAGPRGMVRVAREILTRLAIDDRYIKSEEFSGYE